MAAKKPTTKKQETPQQNSNQENMVFLGGLWANRDKNGQIYFSGYLGSAKLLIFRNKNKTDDKQPDYYMQLVNNRKNNGSASADDLEQELGDDIPF